MLDGIAALLLGVFVLIGVLRGALASGLSLLVLGAAYAAGVLSAVSFGASTSEITRLPALLGPAVAGSLGFVVAYGVFGWGARQVVRWERGGRAGEPRGVLDRAGGGLFGAVRGLAVVLLLGWAALWLEAARQLETGQSAPPGQGSLVARATQPVIEAGAQAVLSHEGPGGRVAGRLLARPAETLIGLQALADEPEIQALGRDGVFWTYVENGAVDAALNRASFYRILHDPGLRRELAAVGAIDAASAADPAAFRREAKTALEHVGPRLRRLRQDPELRALAQDPELARLVEAGNVLGLLRHAGFRRVLARALGDAESG